MVHFRGRDVLIFTEGDAPRRQERSEPGQRVEDPVVRELDALR
jgi:hypothetical protein